MGQSRGIYLDSDLFGHERGAFTGAHAQRKGHIELAREGSIFLDDITKLTLPAQAKLARFLEKGFIERLSGNEHIRLDVRLLAASEEDPGQAAREGRFKRELYHNFVVMEVPPLRERRGDILLLSMHFLRLFSSLNDKKIDNISESAMGLLTNYEYPGNVRELISIIKSAVIAESTNEIRRKSLPHYFLEDPSVLSDAGPLKMPLKTLEDVEKDHIKKILSYTGGNKTKAATILGISRVNLISKAKKYKLE